VTVRVVELVQVIERFAGHYDAEDVGFGTVYKWHPTGVLLQCVCGERLTLTGSTSICGECGAEHTSIVREVLAVRRPQRDEDAHPWRYERS